MVEAGGEVTVDFRFEGFPCFEIYSVLLVGVDSEFGGDNFDSNELEFSILHAEKIVFN